jgi:hypothetical protein
MRGKTAKNLFLCLWVRCMANAISNPSPLFLHHFFNERGADIKTVLDFSAPTMTIPLFIKHISDYIHAISPIKCMIFKFINHC